MSLPSASLAPPAGTPAFLAAGHGITEDSLYANVQPAIGSARKRPRWTVPEREVTVGWLLKGDKIAAVDEWLNVTLQAGSLQFPAHVANQGDGDTLLWWAARWIELPQFEMIPGGFARAIGRLLLTGDGTETGPV